MRADIQTQRRADGSGPRETGFGRKLMWFVALWCAGTGTLAAVAYILRLWIG